MIYPDSLNTAAPAEHGDKHPAKYNLTLTEQQAKVIGEALDLYTRLALGQFYSVTDHPAIRNIIMENPSPHILSEVEKLLAAAKKMVFPDMPERQYHGIRSDKVIDSARIAYDLFQVIQYRLAWDKPVRGFGVHHQMPVKSSTTQELAEIKAGV